MPKITTTDSLVTHTDMEAALEVESGQGSVHKYQPRHKKEVPADTLPPDPRQMRPLPPGQPLEMKPDALESDYWEHALTYMPKNAFVQQLDSVAGVKKNSLVGLKTSGIAGDPVPYLFRTDSFVTIVLMVSFFLVVWVISRSRHYLRHQVKDFFHHRQRENLFAERTQTEMRGQLFLIFQTCFVLGILFFDYTQDYQVQVFNQLSPYKVLGVSVGLCCVYFLFKMATYAFVNHIFFERKQNEQWAESYMLCVLGLGLALLPVALLVVYFDLSMHNMFISFFCILVIDKMLLLYKCSRIFFSYTLGWVHLFLYFCTLEIAPLFILFRALIYACNFLLTIN